MHSVLVRWFFLPTVWVNTAVRHWFCLPLKVLVLSKKEQSLDSNVFVHIPRSQSYPRRANTWDPELFFTKCVVQDMFFFFFLWNSWSSFLQRKHIMILTFFCQKTQLLMETDFNIIFHHTSQFVPKSSSELSFLEASHWSDAGGGKRLNQSPVIIAFNEYPPFFFFFFLGNLEIACV